MKRSADRIYDELLVLRSREGDRRAFAELVARWQSRLLAHAMQLTGRREAAQDAVQEAWIAIIRGLARLEDPARFPGFAHRILARRCADWTRQQQRRRRASLGLAQAGVEVGEPRDPGGAEQASDSMRLREALGRMPVAPRVILALHYLQELPIARIARILGVPPGTVKSRLHAAREQLRRTLERRSGPWPRSTT